MAIVFCIDSNRNERGIQMIVTNEIPIEEFLHLKQPSTSNTGATLSM